MAARLDGSPLLSEESMRLLDGIEALVQGTHHRPPITAPDPFGVANEDRALAAPARGGGTAGRGYVADHEARDVVTVQCATTAGALTMAVHRDWAPHGAQRFLAMVQGGFFDTHVPLFRCVDQFICQTGIAGDARVHRNWQRKGRIPDDLPRLNMATSRPFKRGMVSFAGGGTDSRGTEFFFALDDIDLGGAAWEVPFAAVVGHESFATLGRWHRGYGEIAAFGGRAPDQQMMYRKGVEYTRAGFPSLDYITRCDVV
jgi:peptidyl-prolyl cis-trans isomerase A (cyclophilin A)